MILVKFCNFLNSLEVIIPCVHLWIAYSRAEWRLYCSANVCLQSVFPEYSLARPCPGLGSCGLEQRRVSFNEKLIASCAMQTCSPTVKVALPFEVCYFSLFGKNRNPEYLAIKVASKVTAQVRVDQTRNYLGLIENLKGRRSRVRES